jgi:hypothetical protein
MREQLGYSQGGGASPPPLYLFFLFIGEIKKRVQGGDMLCVCNSSFLILLVKIRSCIVMP